MRKKYTVYSVHDYCQENKNRVGPFPGGFRVVSCAADSFVSKITKYRLYCD